jgi:transferase CAF17, mitochondrial
LPYKKFFLIKFFLFFSKFVVDVSSKTKRREMTTTLAASSSSATTALERAIARTLDAFIRRSARGGGSGATMSSSGQSKSLKGGFKGVFLGKSRSVVRLTGKDGKKLLQGLLTNDVDLLLEDDDNNTNTMYAAMLTPKGRIVTDVFLTRGRSDDGGRRNNDEILIDSCQRAKETLLTQIVRRKLRSDVSVEDASEELSVRVMPPSFDTDYADSGGRGNVLLPADPRWFGLGRRGIVFDATKKTEEDAELDEKVYANWRHANGVPEGSLELGERFPAESRLTHLHAVSFTKGCYVGQEPTARAEFQGEVRKGVVPVVFDENKEVKINGIVISKKDGKEIGKVVASRGGGVGLALVRFAKVENVSEGVSIETVDESGDGGEKEEKAFTECEFGTPNWWSHHWNSRD